MPDADVLLLDEAAFAEKMEQGDCRQKCEWYVEVRRLSCE